MLHTTMTRHDAYKQEGNTVLEFEWICPNCHYPVEDEIVDDDLKDGDEISLQGTCPNCDAEVLISSYGPLHVEDYDDWMN